MADNDCYHRALPDEPKFTLLARDPLFFLLVMAWAENREQAVQCGDRPVEDMALVTEARQMAREGSTWRRNNMGKWRR